MAPLHPGLEALQDGFFMLDPDGRVTYWNPAVERLLDTSRDSVFGRVLWEALPWLRSSRLWGLLRDVREEDDPREVVFPYPPDGEERIAARAVPLEAGGIAVYLRYMTEELKLTAQYTRLLESIKNGFVAVDPDWKIVYINGIARSWLRLPRRWAVGSSLWSLLPAQAGGISESLQATMDDGNPRRLEMFRPGGRIFRDRAFDLWMYPLPGGGVSILFEDVSDRVRRERDLARFAAEAQEANRAKSRFFAAVSHELRTPLNAIIGYAHLLSTETYGRLPPDAMRAADRAYVCAEHLMNLVDDVLLLTTTEVGRLPIAPVTTSLDSFLYDVVEPLRHQAEAKGLRWVLEVRDDIPSIETDPARLRQLLLAILSNAVKFTRRGEVRVDAYSVDLASGDGESRGDSAPEIRFPSVEIAISDTGPGIPERDRERIFAPFEQLGDPSRTDSMTRGTGMGLTLARQLATLLRGDLWADEREGGGATFHLRLPVALGEETSGR